MWQPITDITCYDQSANTCSVRRSIFLSELMLVLVVIDATYVLSAIALTDISAAVILVDCHVAVIVTATFYIRAATADLSSLL